MVNKTKRSSKWIVTKNNSQGAGVHIIAELWGVVDIKDPEKFEKILLDAATLAKARPLKVYVHKFLPQGMTGVVVLAESHITFHTWPEMKYLALDIFTCGEQSEPYRALDHFKKILKPKSIQVVEIKRGVRK